MNEQGDKQGSIPAQPTANQEASTALDAKPAEAAAQPSPAPPEARKTAWKRKLLAGVLGVVVLAVLVVFGIPWIEAMLSTVSTDDAYVNGHVTFVAPRVPGQISRVLVDDNNRVRKGDRLAELDKEPYRVVGLREEGGRRHRGGGPAGGESRRARDRGGRKEQALEPATRRGKRG